MKWSQGGGGGGGGGCLLVSCIPMLEQKNDEKGCFYSSWAVRSGVRKKGMIFTGLTILSGWVSAPVPGKWQKWLVFKRTQ